MTDAGWFRDPAGVADLRFHNGTTWTAHVATGRQQWVSPLPTASSNPAPTAAPQLLPAGTLLWEGERVGLAHAATAGRVVAAKYRITSDAVHFEAGLLSTRAESIPISYVVDVDVTQSVTQKPRGVGDVVIHLDPAAARFGQTTVRLESVREPRSVRDLLRGQAQFVRRFFFEIGHQHEIERRQAGASNLNIGIVPNAQPAGSTGGVALPDSPGPTPVAAPAPTLVEQLKGLAELRDAGVLTEDEFQTQKARMLGS